MEVGNLYVKLGVDDQEFREKLMTAQQLLAEFDKGFLTSFGVLGVGNGSGVGGFEILGMNEQMSEMGNEFGQCADRRNANQFRWGIFRYSKHYAKRNQFHFSAIDAREFSIRTSWPRDCAIDGSRRVVKSKCFDRSSCVCSAKCF